MPATLAVAAFFLYAALNGVTLSLIFAVYTTESIAGTFFVTAGMFGAMAALGWITKRASRALAQSCSWRSSA